jgi:hypothetical protein
MSDDTKAATRWRSPAGIFMLVAGALGIYHLLTEHLTHVTQAVPYLFLLACPLMHLLGHCHGSHGHAEHRPPTAAKRAMTTVPRETRREPSRLAATPAPRTTRRRFTITARFTSSSDWARSFWARVLRSDCISACAIAASCQRPRASICAGVMRHRSAKAWDTRAAPRCTACASCMVCSPLEGTRWRSWPWPSPSVRVRSSGGSRTRALERRSPGHGFRGRSALHRADAAPPRAHRSDTPTRLRP